MVHMFVVEIICRHLATASIQIDVPTYGLSAAFRGKRKLAAFQCFISVNYSPLQEIQTRPHVG
ncbi:hypothetical protein BH10PLA2_BH10PLA2_25750 [soil metagenome]